MNHKYLILFLLFFCKNLFCFEIQYFISEFFYKNPHSYSINGFKLVKYFPGELLESALKSNQEIYKSCEPETKTDYIVNLYPITVYDPFLKSITTDMKVKIFSENTVKPVELIVSYHNQVFLKEDSENLITEHYTKLIDKLSNKVSEIKLPSKKIDGKNCLNFQ